MLNFSSIHRGKWVRHGRPYLQRLPNVYLCRGANPKHAILFAKDVPPSKVMKILDRYLMLYVRTADKLTRTARWLENFEGGVEVSF